MAGRVEGYILSTDWVVSLGALAVTGAHVDSVSRIQGVHPVNRDAGRVISNTVIVISNAGRVISNTVIVISNAGRVISKRPFTYYVITFCLFLDPLSVIKFGIGQSKNHISVIIPKPPSPSH